MHGWCLCAAAVCGPLADARGETRLPAAQDILDAVLDRDDGHRERLRRYLSERYRAPPGRVAALARKLIGDLEGAAAGLAFGKVRNAVDRVVQTTGALLATTRILTLGVEAGYRPNAPLLALDLGPAGAPSDGFVRVDAADKRVGGQRMTEVRGDPGELLGSGIRGVERLELDVPDGSYRVILLTQPPDRAGVAPFGREIRVNGISHRLTRRAGESWISAALLPGGGVLRPATAAARTAAGGFAFVHRSRGAAENGGAVVVEGRAAGGRLVLEFEPVGALPVFLSGVLVERANRRGDLVLGGEAPRYATSLGERIALEERVVSAARRTLERANAAAGRRSLFELPHPGLSRPRGGDAS